MRPLTQLLDEGITFDTIPCDSTGSIQMDSIEPLIRPNTVALIINHASNVCGTIQRSNQLARSARLIIYNLL